MIRINDCKGEATLKAAALVSLFLILVAGTAFGQQQINLTAMPTTTTMPDGTVLPMWGYFCGAAVSGSTSTPMFSVFRPCGSHGIDISIG